MKQTNSIVSFTPKNSIVLGLASLLSITGFVWPFFYTGTDLPRTQMFFWIAIVAAVFLVATEISQAGLDAKSIALLGVLSALISALRPLGAGAVGIEPMWFVLILSARVFGPSFGFLLGVTSMFTSALLTGGVGPWLGYQIFAAAWLGMAAGLLPKKISGKGEIAMLLIFGAIASAIFGLLMDLQFWPWALGFNTQLSYIPGGSIPENLSRFITFHFASSMAWDIPRAIFTCILIGLTGSSVLSALRRANTKAAFSTPVVFIERVK